MNTNNKKPSTIDVNQVVDNYLDINDWRVKENSTVTYSIGGLILSNSGTMTANYWLNNVYDDEIAEAHKNADIHIHDLSMLSGYCFTGDTRIMTPDGKNPTFQQLVDEGVQELPVFAYDKMHGRTHVTMARNPRVTRQTKLLAKVRFFDGSEVTCTPDHLFMKKDGSYVPAYELRFGTPVKTINHKVRKDQTIVGRTQVKRVRYVHKVTLTEPVNVYDLTVPKYHNFALASGIVVHNCAGWNLKQLIQEGLGGVPGKITSAPASHLSTLCNQMVNFMGIMQNEWAGAQAFSSFDTYLAPFVKADNLSYKEVKQCIQSFVFGTNVSSRWGNQAPFTNITLDWTVPNDLKNINAIVGGKEMPYTYGDCQKEMDMINKAFIEIMIEGDANGRGFQ